MMRSRAILSLLHAASALDNGLGVTPPMGWRHWKAFYAHIDQRIMTDMMHEMVKPYPVDGVLTSLKDLGYLYVGLDDHWQNCTRICENGTTVPSWLPWCHDGECDYDYQCCRAADGTCHDEGSNVLPYYDADGTPRLDTHRFPNMAGMVAHAHDLGLRAGWYMGNYQCGAGTPSGDVDLYIRGSVDAIAQYGFDSVKLDSGWDLTKNLSRWAELLNASGRPVLVENCHQGAEGPGVDDPNVGRCTGLGAVSDCPFNFWRTTGDPEPSWGTIMRELNTLRATVNRLYPSGKQSFLELRACSASAVPEQQWELAYDAAGTMTTLASRSDGGCLEINGCATGEHSRVDTNFGCKPLPPPGWPNRSICEANMAWATNANGTITSVMDGKCLTVGADDTRLEVSSCGAATTTWELTRGKALTISDGSEIVTIREAGGARRCIGVGTTPSYNSEPPLSRPGGFAYPGTMVVGDGSLTLSETRVHFGGWCITSSPLVLAYNLSDAAARALVWETITNTEAVQVNQAWDGAPGAQVAHSLGSNGRLEVWAKPVGRGRVAAFVINTEDTGADNATVDLELALLNLTGTVRVRDVWAKADLGEATGTLRVSVEHHGSAFFVFVPAGEQWPDPFKLAPWMRSAVPPPLKRPPPNPAVSTADSPPHATTPRHDQPAPARVTPCYLNASLATLPYCDASLPLDTRVADLTGRLSLVEKLDQMRMTNDADEYHLAGVPRLGVPPLVLSECLHDIGDSDDETGKYTCLGGAPKHNESAQCPTTYPSPVALGASFDEDLWRRIGAAVGAESRALHNAGVERAGLICWSPVVNLVRDPRWGRADECPSEDPLLAGRYGVSFTSGLQSEHVSPPHLQVHTNSISRYAALCFLVAAPYLPRKCSHVLFEHYGQVAATLKHFGICTCSLTRTLATMLLSVSCPLTVACHAVATDGMDNWCPFIQPPNAATERSSSTADSVCYNRGHFISNVSLPDLHDYFLEPFRRGVVDGGARSMMISEDGVNGSPGPTSPLLSMTRQQWYACEPLHSIRPHLS